MILALTVISQISLNEDQKFVLMLGLAVSVPFSVYVIEKRTVEEVKGEEKRNLKEKNRRTIMSLTDCYVKINSSMKHLESYMDPNDPDKPVPLESAIQSSIRHITRHIEIFEKIFVSNFGYFEIEKYIQQANYVNLLDHIYVIKEELNRVKDSRHRGEFKSAKFVFKSLELLLTNYANRDPVLKEQMIKEFPYFEKRFSKKRD